MTNEEKALKSEFLANFEDLKCCCLATDIEPTEVIDVAHSSPAPRDDSGAAVFRTENGWFTLSEWQDYTGHGCQCGSSIQGPYESRTEAIRMGLTTEERRFLDITISGLDPEVSE